MLPHSKARNSAAIQYLLASAKSSGFMCKQKNKGTFSRESFVNYMFCLSPQTRAAGVISDYFSKSYDLTRVYK
jgi:hypothetical protein